MNLTRLPPTVAGVENQPGGGIARRSSQVGLALEEVVLSGVSRSARTQVDVDDVAAGAVDAHCDLGCQRAQTETPRLGLIAMRR